MKVKSVLACCRQFVFCISVIVTRVRIADSCVWNFDFHVSLFHFLWSYFCERSLPNKPIVPSAFSGLEGFLVFIKLAESNQYILAPFESYSIYGPKCCKEQMPFLFYIQPIKPQKFWCIRRWESSENADPLAHLPHFPQRIFNWIFHYPPLSLCFQLLECLVN